MSADPSPLQEWLTIIGAIIIVLAGAFCVTVIFLFLGGLALCLAPSVCLWAYGYHFSAAFAALAGLAVFLTILAKIVI